MDYVFFILEIIGTVAFAISGALVAIKKEMDVFGVVILGITTAVGGGMIRDVILGLTPPTIFNNSVYLIVAAVVSLIVFIPFVLKFVGGHNKVWEKIHLISDSVGLGVFTVIGVQVAFETSDTNILFAIFTGVITGVGGGVIRDMFAGLIPSIFSRHFYACASIAGAFVCAVLYKYAGKMIAEIFGAIVVVTLRLLAAKYHWSLPKPKKIQE